MVDAGIIDVAAAEREQVRQYRLHLNRRLTRLREYFREQGNGGFGFGGVQASKKAIAALHVPAVGETRELDCAVCLEDFKDGDDLRMMPCSHSFHQTCISRWLAVSRLCPICRFVMPSVADELRLLHEQAEAERRQTRND